MRRTLIVSKLPFAELRRELEGSFAEARMADRGAGTRVYFIQESGMGAIKIGISKHAQVRRRELQDSIPYDLTLLGTVEGGRAVEAVTHSLFAHAHLRGEWFRPVEELLEHIAKECEAPEVTRKRELEELFEIRRNMRIIA